MFYSAVAKIIVMSSLQKWLHFFSGQDSSTAQYLKEVQGLLIDKWLLEFGGIRVLQNGSNL